MREWKEKQFVLKNFEEKLFNYTLSDERRWRNYLKENHEKYIWKNHENSFESSFLCSKVLNFAGGFRFSEARKHSTAA